jgi:hypothetical protein
LALITALELLFPAVDSLADIGAGLLIDNVVDEATKSVGRIYRATFGRRQKTKPHGKVRPGAVGDPTAECVGLVELHAHSSR